MLPVDRGDPLRRGHAAEAIAKAYLKQQGLKFVDQNVHCRYGEVDLIFRTTEELVFIEVRYRKQARFGEAWETVSHSKQKKLLTTASYYLQKTGLSTKMSCRFDVLGLSPIHSPINEMKKKHPLTEHYKGHAITWFKHAFSLDGLNIY